MSPSFIPQVKLARRPSNARVAPLPACRQVSPSRRAISAGAREDGLRLAHRRRALVPADLGLPGLEEPLGAEGERPQQAQLVDARRTAVEVEALALERQGGPLAGAPADDTVGQGESGDLPAAGDPGHRSGGGSGAGTAGGGRAIGVAAARGAGASFAGGSAQQPSRTSPPGSETRAVYSVAPPPSAASAIVSRHASRVITATRSGPDASARPRYTKKGGRPHPSSCRRPAKPVCTRPWEPRVASVAEGPSIRRFHSGSWPRQTRTGSPARGAAAARSGSRSRRRALR